MTCPTVDFLVRVILPLLTLVVLFLGFRIAHRTLARSVTPQVQCFLRPQPFSQTFELVIANYGLGCAYNVSLNLEVCEEDFKEHKVVMAWRKTETPFNVIEPGGCISTIFGIGLHLLGSEPLLMPFSAVVQYQWQPFWCKRRRSEKRCYELDVRPFKGLAYQPTTDEVAKVLKSELPKIAKAVGAKQRQPIPRDTRSEDQATFNRMEAQMPSLLAEMRTDLNSCPLKREFILTHKGSTYNSGPKEPLGYYFEDHDDLADKVGLLVNVGLVTDITYNKVDRYVISEPLAQYFLDNAPDPLCQHD